MLDLVEILKDCPKGTKFYSSVYGELIYSSMYTDSLDPRIYFVDENNRSIIFGYYRDGRLYDTKGECTIFPSKDQKDWSKFDAPRYKKDEFDPNTLKPFDKVIARLNQGPWCCELFSFIEEGTNLVKCCGAYYTHCVPYNDETKHLVGTTNEAPEYYRYWEN